MISILLKTDKVYDKNKGRLRLQDVGYPGLTSLMLGEPISPAMAQGLLEQTLLLGMLNQHQCVSYSIFYLLIVSVFFYFDSELRIMICSYWYILSCFTMYDTKQQMYSYLKTLIIFLQIQPLITMQPFQFYFYCTEQM